MIYFLAIREHAVEPAAVWTSLSLASHCGLCKDSQKVPGVSSTVTFWKVPSCEKKIMNKRYESPFVYLSSHPFRHSFITEFDSFFCVKKCLQNEWDRTQPLNCTLVFLCVAARVFIHLSTTHLFSRYTLYRQCAGSQAKHKNEPELAGLWVFVEGCILGFTGPCSWWESWR